MKKARQTAQKDTKKAMLSPKDRRALLNLPQAWCKIIDICDKIESEMFVIQSVLEGYLRELGFTIEEHREKPATGNWAGLGWPSYIDGTYHFSSGMSRCRDFFAVYGPAKINVSIGFYTQHRPGQQPEDTNAFYFGIIEKLQKGKFFTPAVVNRLRKNEAIQPYKVKHSTDTLPGIFAELDVTPKFSYRQLETFFDTFRPVFAQVKNELDKTAKKATGAQVSRPAKKTAKKKVAKK